MKALTTTLIICVLHYSSPAISEALQITYFCNNNYPIAHSESAAEYGMKIAVYNLDAHANLEAALRSGLPADRQEAAAIAEQRLTNLDEAETMRMFQGVAMSIGWQVKKVPAFVFGDGRYVIYGVTDTAAAIRIFRNRRDFSGD